MNILPYVLNDGIDVRPIDRFLHIEIYILGLAVIRPRRPGGPLTARFSRLARLARLVRLGGSIVGVLLSRQSHDQRIMSLLVLEARLALRGRRSLARRCAPRSGLVMTPGSLRSLRPALRPCARRHRRRLLPIDVMLGRWFGVRSFLQGPRRMRERFHRPGRARDGTVRFRELVDTRPRGARRYPGETREGGRRRSGGPVPGGRHRLE